MNEEPTVYGPIDRVAVTASRVESLLNSGTIEPRAHHFHSTGEAYDASQVRDSIRDGDVLVVASESVVGVFVGAWPVAVTPTQGEFHGYDDRVAGPLRELNGGQYAASLKLAEDIAATMSAPECAQLDADELRVLRTYANGPRIWDAASLFGIVTGLDARGLIAPAGPQSNAFVITPAGRATLDASGGAE